MQYEYHQGSVNTVTFFENNKHFMSTGDDRKVVIWDYRIPAPLKLITDPALNVLPNVTLHPDDKTLLAQSMDNKIETFYCTDTIRFQPKKSFKGHHVAGYSCQIGVSPDGQYVCSGDGNGILYFWDFKTTKITRKIDAHKGSVCVDTKWHPIEPNIVASCGWDSTIKLFG